MPASRSRRGGAASASAAAQGVEGNVLAAVLDPEHAAEVRATNQHEMDVKCQRGHRNRQIEMIKWIKEKYPDQFAHCVVELTAEQKADPDLKYFKATHDFIYEKVNVNIIRAFLSAEKKYRDATKTTQYSEVHIRKYHDAIKFGCRTIDAALPQEYHTGMAKYLMSVKKEKKKAKEKGLLDEAEADPIAFPLYKQICQWFLEEDDMTSFVFTLFQWNCMARSINIDPLGFHNFSKGQEDSIEILYGETKMDKTGENVMPKNIFGNPFDHRICVFFALGTYLCINRDKFVEGQDFLFRFGNTKEKMAAKNYCKALKQLVSTEARKEYVRQYCRLDHFHAHGTRKGSSVLATSGTTCPPPLTSVFHRGEWSLGDVKDVYWQWAAEGDTYLGRILAGHDPDSPDFDVLPAHFREGFDNEYISEAMRLCFGNIIDLYADDAAITGLLMLCLASLVHHSDKIEEIVSVRPGHSLGTIPIMNDANLLSELKKLVTLEPAGEVQRPSGIPPHVRHSKELRRAIEELGALNTKIEDMQAMIKESVKESIEEASAGAGQVTASRVMEILDEKFASFTKTTTETIRAALPPSTTIERDIEVVEDPTNRPGCPYCHSGRWWQTPKNFQFPSIALEAGWSLWTFGLPGNKSTDSAGKIIDAPVQPFRLLNQDYVPKNIRRVLASWQRVYRLMEAGGEVGTKVASVTAGTIKSTFLSETFKLGLENVRARASYCFDQPKWRSWKVARWDNRTSRSSILKEGNERDKAKLPEESFRNKLKPSGSSRNRKKGAGIKAFVQVSRRTVATGQKRKRGGAPNSAAAAGGHSSSSRTSSDAPILLEFNPETKRFADTDCEFCNSGLSTRHRCQVEDPNGKYMYRNNGPNVPPTLICGKAFCVLCMERWGSESRTNCERCLGLDVDARTIAQAAAALTNAREERRNQRKFTNDDADALFDSMDM